MRIRVLVLISFFVILALALDTGFILIWRLLFLSLLAILVSFAWTFLNSRGMGSQTGRLPKQCQVGDSFAVEFILFNRIKVPKLLLEVQENSDLPGYNGASVFNLPPDGFHCWRTEVYCRRRGRYNLGSLTVTARDPFGLFRRSRNLGESQSILIYPATLELPFFEILPQSDFKYGLSPWLANQLSANVASVREYTAGDSLRHIHWRSTAHTGQLQVKVFDPDRSRNVRESVWIIVDMHQGSHRGDYETEEYCVTIAASLAKKYIDSGWSVGLIAAGDQFHRFPPEAGSQHLGHILAGLALTRATGNVPVDQLISNESGRFAINSALIVITPQSGERLTAPLRQVKGRGRLVVAILIEPAKLDEVGTMASTIRTLISSGLQVHLVRCGDDIARTLDSRGFYSRTRYSWRDTLRLLAYQSRIPREGGPKWAI